MPSAKLQFFRHDSASTRVLTNKFNSFIWLRVELKFLLGLDDLSCMKCGITKIWVTFGSATACILGSLPGCGTHITRYQGGGTSATGASTAPFVRTGDSGSNDPLNLTATDWIGLSPSFGFYGSSLKGRCLGEYKVHLQGDVAPMQSVSCRSGSFEFPLFRLSDGDGVKRLWVSQEQSSGQILVSQKVEVLRETSRVYRIPGDVAAAEVTSGLREGMLSDVFSQGQVLVLSLRSGGFVLSRDGGKTWYSKSIAQGLSSGAAQKLFGFRDTLYATSTRGFYTSADSGKSWKKSEAAKLDKYDPHTNGFHVHEGRIFVDVGFSGAIFSDDGGKTWLRSGALPYVSGSRTWKSVGGELFVTARDGVHVYNKAENTWSPWSIPDLPPGERITSISSFKNVHLIRTTEWPEVYNQSLQSFRVSEDGGATWRIVHSTRNTVERVEFVAGKLLRWNSQNKQFDVRVSQDGGRYWAPMSLPPQLLLQSNVLFDSVHVTADAILLRDRDRFALSINAELTRWKTFVLPEALHNSKLLSFRQFNRRSFLVFENALLSSDENQSNWTILMASEPTGSLNRGVASQGEQIFVWGEADGFSRRLGSFALADLRSRSFQRITGRLGLLDGFYSDGKISGSMYEIASLGYTTPVLDVRFGNGMSFVSTPEGVFTSSDFAKTFERLRGPEGRPLPLPSGIDVDGSHVAIATKNNGILLSNDSGKTWKIVTKALGLPSDSTTRISVSGNVVLLLAGGQVVMSPDFGTTWRKLELANLIPSSTIVGDVYFFRDKIAYTLRTFEKSPEGSNFAKYTVAVSPDAGKTFFTSVLPDNFRALVDFEFWKNEWYFASSGSVWLASADLKQMRQVMELDSSISRLEVTDTGLLVATTSGLFATGGFFPVVLEESEAIAQRADSLNLEICSDRCSTDENGAASVSPSGQASSQTTLSPVLRVSSCVFNFRTSKCDYTISWLNAPAGSCLWINSAAGVRRFECGLPDNPTTGRATVGWLSSGQGESFFLAREVGVRVPGPKLAEVSIQLPPMLDIAACHAFGETHCTARVTWRNAPVNSCLWGIDPETDRVYLAACATTNPTAHVFDTPWIKYGFTNKFFLARQTSNPNIPEPTKSAEAQLFQPSR